MEPAPEHGPDHRAVALLQRPEAGKAARHLEAPRVPGEDARDERVEEDARRLGAEAPASEGVHRLRAAAPARGDEGLAEGAEDALGESRPQTCAGTRRRRPRRRT